MTGWPSLVRLQFFWLWCVCVVCVGVQVFPGGYLSGSVLCIDRLSSLSALSSPAWWLRGWHLPHGSRCPPELQWVLPSPRGPIGEQVFATPLFLCSICTHVIFLLLALEMAESPALLFYSPCGLLALPWTVQWQEYRKSGSTLNPSPFPKGLGPSPPGTPHFIFQLLQRCDGRKVCWLKTPPRDRCCCLAPPPPRSPLPLWTGKRPQRLPEWGLGLGSTGWGAFTEMLVGLFSPFFFPFCSQWHYCQL